MAEEQIAARSRVQCSDCGEESGAQHPGHVNGSAQVLPCADERKRGGKRGRELAHAPDLKQKPSRTRPNQTKPNQTQTKPNQIKPNQTKPKPNQTKPNQTKTTATKPCPKRHPLSPSPKNTHKQSEGLRCAMPCVMTCGAVRRGGNTVEEEDGPSRWRVLRRVGV